MNEQKDQNQQASTDRSGSQTGPAGSEGKAATGQAQPHQSNDVTGGLPRSPGNSGPRSEDQSWKPGQSVQADKDPVHESNDVAGGLPKSPAGANRLAGDRMMDDDTGFSRK